jgi:hypothetical protein
VFLALGWLFTVGCGGSASNGTTTSGINGGVSNAGGNSVVTSGTNIAPLIVDPGPVPATNPQANTVFTTVTVCVPGSTTNCQTIDHVAVDTGSTGLRIPYSTLNATLVAQLQNVNGTGTPLAECIQFLDNSFFWGSVRFADVKMGGASNNSEVAASIPIHVMGDPALPSGTSIPASCSNTVTLSGQQISGTEEDTVSTLGANGLLGVGNFQYDCDLLGGGNACISAATLPPATYYACSGGACTDLNLTVSLGQQLRNPVSMFTTDNNGVIIELAAIPVGGQSGIAAGQGSLVFGIGTQANNALASGATILTLDPNINDPAWGGFTTVFNGVSYPNSLAAPSGSFIDSGSNGIFFLDQPTSGIADCSGAGSIADFYCPASTDALSATNKAINGNSRGVQFNVSNAITLLSGNFSAFSDLAGPNTSGSPNSSTRAADGYFDWGLSFFYGRNVYTTIQGVTPPSGVQAGPFWAY